MPSCVVKCCRNHSGTKNKCHGITFHRFPIGNEVWRSDLINIIRECRGENDWVPSKSSVICSMHFNANDLYKTKGGTLRVVTYAVPKKFLYVPQNMEEIQRVEPSVSNAFKEKSEIFCELNLDPLHTPTEDNSINVKSETISGSNLDHLHIPIEDIAIDTVKSERISEANPHVFYVPTEDIDIDNVKSERSSESYSDALYVPTEENDIDNTVNCEEMVSSNNSLEGVITHIIASKPQCLISDLQLTSVAISENPDQVVNHIETSPCRSGSLTKKTEDLLKYSHSNKIITKLKIKCEKQHKKIKALQSQLRRYRKKTTDLQNIIKKLKDNQPDS